jgi:heptose-I-phosphate ethanolaminephosphotransferase
MVNHPEIAHAIVTSRSRRFMTDALPHMLLYLAGIHTKDYRPELNVLSSDYDEQRPRIVKATADYDEVMNQE